MPSPLPHVRQPDTTRAIDIAHWDSKTSRYAMEARPDPEVKEIIHSAAPCC